MRICSIGIVFWAMFGSVVYAQGVNDRMPTGAPQYPTTRQPDQQPSPSTATPNRAADWGQRRMYEQPAPRVQGSKVINRRQY